MHKIIPSKLKWQKTTYSYFRKIAMQVKNTPGKECKVQFIWIPPNSTSSERKKDFVRTRKIKEALYSKYLHNHQTNIQTFIL